MSEQNRHLANISTHTRNMWAKLCELVEASASIPPTPFTITGEDCSGAAVIAEATSTVQTVPHPDFVQKVQLCSAGIDPEVVCLSNDGGTTVVQGIAEFDTSTVPSTKTLYLFDGTIATGYSVVSCGKSMQYDYEKITVCVDGFSYTKWYVWDKTGDVTPNLVSILWLDQNDVPVAAPDPLLINNANCTSLCTPTISDAFADDISTLLPATNFIITN